MRWRRRQSLARPVGGGAEAVGLSTRAGSCLPDAAASAHLLDRGEDREVQVGRARLLWGHTADHAGAVLDCLLRVEGTLRAMRRSLRGRCHRGAPRVETAPKLSPARAVQAAGRRKRRAQRRRGLGTHLLPREALANDLRVLVHPHLCGCAHVAHPADSGGQGGEGGTGQHLRRVL